MATLAISINLDQVRQAQGQFDALVSKLHLSAMTTMLKIQGEFNKGINLGAFDKSLKAYLSLLSDFESYTKLTMGYVRTYFAMRPSLKGFREAFVEFQAIATGFERVGKQMRANIANAFAGGQRQFTPAIDIQRVKTSETKFLAIMQQMEDGLTRHVKAMIKQWDRYMTVVNLVVSETRILAMEMQRAFQALGPLSQVFSAVVNALRQMTTASHSAAAGLKGTTTSMRGMNVIMTQGGSVVGSFNRNLNQTPRAAAVATQSIHNYRDSLLGLFFLFDKFNVVALARHFVTLGKELNKTQMSMDSIMATLRVAFGAEQAVIEFERVRQLSLEIGVNGMEMTEQWARASVAAKNMALFGKDAWAAFSGIARASAVFGKNPEEAFNALVQILSKGQLSMEEIRQQMSETLPGAFGVFKQAAIEAGTTLEQVTKNTGTGFGKMNEVFRNAGRLLNETYGPEARKNIERLRGATALLSNAWDEVKNAINAGGFNEAWIAALKAVTEFLSEPETMVAMRAFGKALGSVIPDAINRGLIPALKFLRENFDKVITTVVVLTTTLTGLIKGGLISLALAPFTGGMSLVPMAIGAGAGAAAGLGITEGVPGLATELFDLVKQVFNGFKKIFLWIWNLLEPLEKLADKILGPAAVKTPGAPSDPLDALQKALDQVIGSPKSTIPGDVGGISDAYRESLKKAREEVALERVNRERAGKGLLPHPAPGAETPGVHPDVEKMNKRTLDFIRRQEAQIKEMTDTLRGIQTITEGTTESVAKSTGTSARTLTALQVKIRAAAEVQKLDPDIFEALIWAESKNNPRAEGRMTKYGTAKGLGQLIDSTAKDMGVTDPFDVDQNLAGSAKYLAKMLRQFGGNIELAMAAYNAGPGAVKKYGGVPPFQETQDYIKRILTKDAELRGGTNRPETTTRTTAPQSSTSEEFETRKRYLELVRQAEASGADVSDSELGQSLKKTLLESAKTAENLQRFMTKLKAVELEEAKAKEIQNLATLNLNESMIKLGGDTEAHANLLQKTQDIERDNGPLLDDSSLAMLNQKNRLEAAMKAQLSFNRAKEAGEALHKASKETINLEEEAQLKMNLSEGKLITLLVQEGDVIARNRAEAEAFLKARQALFPNDRGIADIRTTKTVDGKEVEGETLGQLSDERVRAELDAKRSLSVSETVQSLKNETMAQQDLIDVVGLGIKERERELAFRSEVNRLQADGNTLSEDEARRIRATTDALNAKQQAAKNLYSPLKRFAEQFGDDMENLQNSIVSVFSSLEDAVAEFAATGKLDISQMVQSLIKEFTKLALRQAITGPLANMLNTALNPSQGGGAAAPIVGGTAPATGGGWVQTAGGLLKGIMSLFGGGGGAGAGLPATTPFMGFPSYYGGIAGHDIGPRRYAFGGIAGVDTVPAWLTRGEGVFTQAQMRHMAPVNSEQQQSEETPIVVNNVFNFTNTNEETFRRSTSQIEARMTNSARRATQRLR